MGADSQNALPIDEGTLQETIRRVQGEVRREFDAWNLRHLKEVVQRDIRQPIPESSATRGRNIDSLLASSPDVDFEKGEDDARPPWLAPGAPGSPTSSLHETYRLKKAVVTVEYDVDDWNFDPTPEYEYCAPTDNNRYVGDDSSILIFNPLTEKTNPDNHEEFLELHDDLAWTTLADPAGEIDRQM